MSEQAVIEAPQQQEAPQQAAPKYDSGSALRDAMAAQVQHDRGGQPPKQEAPKQEVQKQAKAEPQEQEQVQTEEPAKPEGKQSRWDKLGKPPEKGEQKPVEYPDEAPKEQTAWTGIKKRVKEYEAKEAEWQKQQAEFDAKIKEYESKASEYKPEIIDEWKKYKENEAIDYVQRSDEYIQKAKAPYDQGHSVLMEVSEYTGLPITQIQEALLEQNSILRDEAVLTLMEKSTKEMSDARKEALKNRVIEAGDKMNAAAQEHHRMMQDAQTKREQRELSQKAAEMKAKEESHKVFKSAVTEITEGMKAQLGDLLKDGTFKPEDLSFEDMQLSDDVMDRAFGEYSANLLTKVMPKFWAMKAELAQLQQERKDRMEANPRVKPTKSNGSSAPVPTLRGAMDEYLATRGSRGYM